MKEREKVHVCETVHVQICVDIGFQASCVLYSDTFKLLVWQIKYVYSTPYQKHSQLVKFGV